MAIGAKITLTVDGSGTPSPIRYREVTSGGSFGASTLLQHIGVGKAKIVKIVEIEWPVSRTTQVFHDVPVDSLSGDPRVRRGVHRCGTQGVRACQVTS